jgi:purine-binding chemotaxis protein CheW
MTKHPSSFAGSTARNSANAQAGHHNTRCAWGVIGTNAKGINFSLAHVLYDPIWWEDWGVPDSPFLPWRTIVTDLAANEAPANLEAHPGKDREDFVTFIVAGQLFGIPIFQVRGVLSPETIASIPLAPPEVKGSINLRGRIVTVIDVRLRLGMTKRAADDDSKGVAVTVECQHELYGLLVDRVGDVIGTSKDSFERNPGTLSANWKEFSNGIYRLEKGLMVALDVDHLLDIRKH